MEKSRKSIWSGLIIILCGHCMTLATLCAQGGFTDIFFYVVCVCLTLEKLPSLLILGLIITISILDVTEVGATWPGCGYREVDSIKIYS